MNRKGPPKPRTTKKKAKSVSPDIQYKAELFVNRFPIRLSLWKSRLPYRRDTVTKRTKKEAYAVRDAC